MKTHAQMHSCHRQSRTQHVEWMQTITAWRGKHRSGLASIAQIESLIRQHDGAVEALADEIRLHELEIALHEMEISDHEHTGKDADHQAMTGQHSTKDKAHQRQEKQIKKLTAARAKAETQIRKLVTDLQAIFS